MKPLVAIIGLLLLVTPLLRLLGLSRRLAAASSGEEALVTVMTIPAGLMQGIFAVTVLGFLCDAGRGYKPLWLFVVMMSLGGAWLAFYPHGWMVAIPLIVYSGEKMFRIFRDGRAGATKPVEPTGTSSFSSDRTTSHTSGDSPGGSLRR